MNDTVTYMLTARAVKLPKEGCEDSRQGAVFGMRTSRNALTEVARLQEELYRGSESPTSSMCAAMDGRTEIPTMIRNLGATGQPC